MSKNANKAQFQPGDHVVDIHGGPDYGFWYVEDSNIPGMVILRNNRGSVCVDIATIKKAPETLVEVQQ